MAGYLIDRNMFQNFSRIHALRLLLDARWVRTYLAAECIPDVTKVNLQRVKQLSDDRICLRINIQTTKRPKCMVIKHRTSDCGVVKDDILVVVQLKERDQLRDIIFV